MTQRASHVGKRPGQFSLRSMLMGLVWLGLILAICVHHQKASARHRQWLHSMEAAGMLPGGPRRVTPATGAAPANLSTPAMSIPPSPLVSPPTVDN